MSGIRDLIEIVKQIDPELLDFANGGKLRSRSRRRRVDVDPDEVFDLVFQGAEDERKLWRGTTFDSALALANSYALLISLAIPQMAEVKFAAEFSKRAPSEPAHAFDVRYILSRNKMRRIVEPGTNARARQSVRSSVEDFQR